MILLHFHSIFSPYLLFTSRTSSYISISPAVTSPIDGSWSSASREQSPPEANKVGPQLRPICAPPPITATLETARMRAGSLPSPAAQPALRGFCPITPPGHGCCPPARPADESVFALLSHTAEFSTADHSPSFWKPSSLERPHDALP